MALLSKSTSIKVLQQEFKSLNDSPVEGFLVHLKNDDNIYDWNVVIFGPPGTLYEGGYLKADLKFPNDYPYSPPSMKFVTKMWHPNIYEDGKVCISILHPPGEDPVSGELPSERWNPTQNVRTVLLSVISLLNEPNTSSPANVDASVMYRKWKDGANTEYFDIVRRQVEVTKQEAVADGVTVPTRVEDYVAKGSPAGGRSGVHDRAEQDAFAVSNFDDDLAAYYDDDEDY
ncbi:hypothetical protein BOX15_Mlig011027g1 [Macrostomum lignano]|uniref:UBC core domain-containing protein n=2 Tax=Macrostomum lignano TaxID=282301 RepID=A0A267DLU4_9PLAT|nr:hypothetical protein BOX15_Mlig011027g2 [Macrostomum lignano]PAA87207.1 hypothetical protein BOX15_Mlig011027g1 [Macrostomum lignano]